MTDATGDVDMTPVVDDRKVGDPNPPEIKELLVIARPRTIFSPSKDVQNTEKPNVDGIHTIPIW